MRALRIARTHGLTKTVFELETESLGHVFDLRLAWEHETTLMRLGRDDERAELLVRMARRESDPHRKYTALLGAARLHRQLRSEIAISLLREVRALQPQQQYPREALVDALREARMWPELVEERTSELAAAAGRRLAVRQPGPGTDGTADIDHSRSALREIAWVQEVCLRDAAAAARAYSTWAESMPEDQSALEGLARCSAAIGDSATAVRAHEALVGVARTETARWLLARHLARAGLFGRAVAEFRNLITLGREHVALTAALALVSMATREDDAALRAFGTAELAARTVDGRLAGALHEEVGWFHALTSGETDRAETAFAEAVVRDPARIGALVGSTLMSAARGDGGQLARRYVALAEVVGSELGVPLRLRAAAVALFEDGAAFADEQLAAARSAAPDDEHVKFVMVEVELEVDGPRGRSDPFVVTDRMVERGALLAARAKLVQDPQTRAAYEARSRELLEGAGMLYDAGAIVTAVVRAFPQNRRALLALRRLARHQDPSTFARASFALARSTRDPRWQRELFAEADAGSEHFAADTSVDPAEGFETSLGFDTTATQQEPFGLALADHSDVIVVSVDPVPPSGALRREREQLVESFTAEANLASEPAALAALWTEVGRLAEGLGEWARAKAAYHAAVAADPRDARALRGARRLAGRDHDVAGALALLALEIDVAAGRERRSLQRYRLDMMLGNREYGAARSAIAELLAQDPTDAGSWFASLVSAHVTGDSPTVGLAMASLARLAPELDERAATIGTRWRAIWHAWERNDAAAAVAATLDVALHVEGEDPTVTTALAMFAQMQATEHGPLDAALREPALEAAKLSVRIAPRDPLVARLAAETALAADEPATAAHSFSQWARTKTDPAERAYAAARAAELEPTRLGRMWSTVVEHHPDDEYAVFKLRAHHVAAGNQDDAIAVALRSAREGGRLASMIDAAETMVEETRIDDAIAVLEEARDRWPESLAAVEALADALASVGRWADRAAVLDEATTVRGPIVGARDVLRLRAAAAWDLAAAEASGGRADQLTISALQACERVFEDNPASVLAAGTALKLARKVPDRRALTGVLERLGAAEASPWAKSSLALRRMRVLAVTDPDEAREIARTAGSIDDPRRSVGLALAFDLPAAGEVSLAIEARAEQCEHAGQTIEASTLFLRAAHVAAQAGDGERALGLCARTAAFPRVVADLETALGSPRRDGGEVGYTRSMLDADDATRAGDADAAFAAYHRALALRPGDAVARLGQALVGARSGKPAQAALEQLEAAVAVQDAMAELAAYEHLARAAAAMGDRSGVIDAVRNAVRLDPARVDLQAWLERELAAAGDLAAAVQLRHDIVARTATWERPDRVAMLVDTALLALSAGREADVVRSCRAVLELEPDHPFALRHVEAALRRAEPSAELARVHEHVANVLGSATSIRAGQVYAALGRHGDAAAAFARAAAAEPRSVVALDAWQASALDGARWSDLLAIAHYRDAAGAPSAAAFHLAGTALMDRTPVRETAEPAVAALRRVLALEPDHKDAFSRLCLLLDTLGRDDELLEHLRARIAIVVDRDERIALHRELAERLFAGSTAAALQHYRQIVAIDPTDFRAHAAIADIASVHAPWSAAADAVAARVPLERDPRVLHGLYRRLGALYAEHDDAKALEAYHRAAETAPDDLTVLEQIARIAVRLGAWPAAVAASERLVVAEPDRAKRAEHLVRAAAVFAIGFSSVERATRMLLLALENAPTSTVALEALVELLARRDPTALRGPLEQIAARMRARVDADPGDGPAYRMLSRVSATRAALGDRAALVAARAAAEMAVLLGAAEADETSLLARLPAASPSRSGQPGIDAAVLPDSVPPALVAMLRVAAPAIQSVAGLEVGAFGVQRKQRLRGSDPLAVAVRAVLAPLGFSEVDVYLAPQPYVAIAEPGDPLAVVIGHDIASSETGVAFAAGAAGGLARMALAIPARLPPPALHALITALLGLAGRAPATSTPESEALAARLYRHLSPSARAELAHHARALPSPDFPELVRDLQTIRLRAGFAVSGQLRAGLTQLAGASGVDVMAVLSDPLARDLVGFALSERASVLPSSG